MDLSWLVLLLFLGDSLLVNVSGNIVFPVQHKFKGTERNLSALKAHDVRRHRRFLFDIDLELGGNGQPSETGLYFAKLGLGSPPKDYYVQVDTGSDILWVNCVGCKSCPKKSGLGLDLTLYDPKSSSTSSLVACNQAFCTSTYNGQLTGCKPDVLCQYEVVYGDGSSTSGYFVNDNVQFDRVTGNLQTAPGNGSIIFGCGAKQSGELGTSSEALDGILGFGQANSSMLSQLASAGKVKKYLHIAWIMAHYNVVLKEIEVGGDNLSLPSDVFDNGFRKGTIIDSGTTLAYLPQVVYGELMSKILAQQPGLKLRTVEQQFSCFQYNIYPHEYLFQISDNVWCFGWQNGGDQTKDGKDITLLGGSSSIKVKDSSGVAYSVGAHNLSSASTLIIGRKLTFLLLVIATLLSFIN
ncbi:aspartic proteinase-like protein 2 [Quercus suber]|uniref:Aspartic proteinase-like protein 2 n=1 Tax=Quercus suber TaxID=58331 RepID=A0AAW0LTI1_QUESU